MHAARNLLHSSPSVRLFPTSAGGLPVNPRPPTWSVLTHYRTNANVRTYHVIFDFGGGEGGGGGESVNSGRADEEDTHWTVHRPKKIKEELEWLEKLRNVARKKFAEAERS